MTGRELLENASLDLERHAVLAYARNDAEHMNIRTALKICWEVEELKRRENKTRSVGTSAKESTEAFERRPAIT